MCAQREMGSREGQPTTHQPLLSSLVVRPTDSGGVGGGGGGGSDYEPGEVRRDHPPYSRSDRNNGHGYRMRAGSVSPVRRRDTRHRLSPGFERSSGASRSHGFGNGRDSGRFREHSPLYGRGKADSRFAGRGYNQSPRGLEPLRVEGFPRNNPNVQPREGDWICSDPSCKNLNFARRDHCNNCNRPRYASTGNPRRGYPGPLFPPGQHVPVGPLDHSPGRIMHGGYRSPPRGWPRDASRDFRPAVPPRRRGSRFPDPLMRSDRLDYPEDEFRDRYRNDRPMMPEGGYGRDNYFSERRGYGRRVVSPPPGPPVRGWASHIRDRSRSPPGRGVVQPKNYQRDTYMNRMRDNRHVIARDAFFPD